GGNLTLAGSGSLTASGAVNITSDKQISLSGAVTAQTDAATIKGTAISMADVAGDSVTATATAGSVAMSGAVAADNGTVDITVTGGDITQTSAGTITATSDIDLNSDKTIQLAGSVAADEGDVTIEALAVDGAAIAGDNVSINASQGAMNISGVVTADDGDIDLTNEGGNLTLAGSGSLTASGAVDVLSDNRIIFHGAIEAQTQAATFKGIDVLLGDVKANNVTATATNGSVVMNGEIVAKDGAINISATSGGVVLADMGLITASMDVDISSDDSVHLYDSVVSDLGNITIEADSVKVSDLGGENISVTSNNGTMHLYGAVTTDSGDVDFTVRGGTFNQASGGSVTSVGSVNLDSDNEVTIHGSLLAEAGSVTVSGTTILAADVEGDTVTLDSSNGSVKLTGDMKSDVGDIDLLAQGGEVTLDTSGSLFAARSVIINSEGSHIKLSGDVEGDSGSVHMKASSISIENVASTQEISLLAKNGSVSMGGDVASNAGDILVKAAGGDINMTDDASLMTKSNLISLAASGNVGLGYVESGSKISVIADSDGNNLGAIINNHMLTNGATLTTAQKLLNPDSFFNLNSKNIALESGSGIGTHNDFLNINTNNLSANNTGAGGIFVDQTGDLRLVGEGIHNQGGQSGNQGDVALIVRGGSLDIGAKIIAANSALVQVDNDIAQHSDLIANGNFTMTSKMGAITMDNGLVTLARSGDIQYTARGDLLLSVLNSQGKVSVSSMEGALVDNLGAGVTDDMTTNIFAKSASLQAANGIGAPYHDGINTRVQFIEAINTTDGGIFIEEYDGMTIGQGGVLSLNEEGEVILATAVNEVSHTGIEHNVNSSVQGGKVGVGGEGNVEILTASHLYPWELSGSNSSTSNVLADTVVNSDVNVANANQLSNTDQLSSSTQLSRSDQIAITDQLTNSEQQSNTVQQENDQFFENTTVFNNVNILGQPLFGNSSSNLLDSLFEDALGDELSQQSASNHELNDSATNNEPSLIKSFADNPDQSNVSSLFDLNSSLFSADTSDNTNQNVFEPLVDSNKMEPLVPSFTQSNGLLAPSNSTDAILNEIISPLNISQVDPLNTGTPNDLGQNNLFNSDGLEEKDQAFLDVDTQSVADQLDNQIKDDEPTQEPEQEILSEGIENQEGVPSASVDSDFPEQMVDNSTPKQAS
ncbi:MAG: hypothetical protein HQL71_11770, partial [Magnetococcales bacterium]|nr:hypothetical protein [Magnetococcales bacterium]